MIEKFGMQKSIILLLIISGCSKFSSKSIHPISTHFPSADEITYIINVSEYKRNNLSQLFDVNDLIQKSTIKGSRTGEVDTYIDIPSKIDIDSAGNIYFTDEKTQTIRVYNKEGEYSYSVGGRGRGPGEFEQIIKFAFGEGFRKLYVLGRFKIEVFKKNEFAFEYETTIQHKVFRPVDLCILDNWLYISGHKINDGERQDENMPELQASISPPIHRFDLNSHEYKNSFGFIYSSSSGWGYIDARLSETMLGCNSYSKTVVGYLKRYSFLFGYDVRGGQKWISNIEGYLNTESEEYQQASRPAFYSYTNREIFNWKYPIQELQTKEFSVMQFGYTPLLDYIAVSDSTMPFIRTILVNTETGELFHSDNYPYIGSWRNNTVITMNLNSETLDKTFIINEYK